MKRYLPMLVVAGVLVGILWAVSRKSNTAKASAQTELDQVMAK